MQRARGDLDKAGETLMSMRLGGLIHQLEGDLEYGKIIDR